MSLALLFTRLRSPVRYAAYPQDSLRNFLMLATRALNLPHLLRVHDPFWYARKDPQFATIHSLIHGGDPGDYGHYMDLVHDHNPELLQQEHIPQLLHRLMPHFIAMQHENHPGHRAFGVGLESPELHRQLSTLLSTRIPPLAHNTEVGDPLHGVDLMRNAAAFHAPIPLGLPGALGSAHPRAFVHAYDFGHSLAEPRDLSPEGTGGNTEAALGHLLRAQSANALRVILPRLLRHGHLPTLDTGGAP